MSSKRSKKAGKAALLPDNIRSENYQNDVSENKNGDDKTVENVKDKGNLIYWISMLLGCGILMSYNFLISAPDYFEDEYPNHSNINFLIVPAYTIPDVIFLVFALFYGEMFSFTSRICICFLSMGIMMFFPIFTQYIFANSENIGFYIILSVAGFSGLTTAILQTSVIGFCNYLPVSYIQVSISGQSVAGIAAGLIRIIINLIEQYTLLDSKTNGMIYFGIGGLFDILCGILFVYAIRNTFVRFHLSQYFWTRKFRGKEKNISEDLLQRVDTQTLLRKVQDDNMPTPKAKDFETIAAITQINKNKNLNQQIIDTKKKKKKKKKRKRTQKEIKLAKSLEKQQNTCMRFREDTHDDDSDSNSTNQSQSNMTNDDDNDDDDDQFEEKTVETISSTYSINNPYSGGGVDSNTDKLIFPVLNEETQNEDECEYEDESQEDLDENDKVTYFGVFNKIKFLVLALFLVFYVTFLAFPAMLTSLDSQYKSLNDDNWLPVLLVLEFNICDYIGRQYVASYTAFSFSKRTLWIGCLWRILIIPLFIALYMGIIESDIVAYISTGILGITNGHFCCLCFMWAPCMVNSNEQQLCGCIMSFALVMGITAGSYTTLLLNTIKLI